MIVPHVALDPRDDRAGPLHNERLQAVLLVQVIVHELLHSLYWQLRLVAFAIVLHLLGVDITDDVFQLLERQHFGMRLVAQALLAR